MGSKAMADETLVKGASDKAISFVDRTRSFLGDVRTEMRKVTTPSAKEVKATTGVVIITVFLFAIYFYGIDRIIGFVIDHVFQWARG